MALWALLACGLLALQAHGWKFGISLSFDGTWEEDYTRSVTDEESCEHCERANMTLHFWAAASKRLTNLGDVTFDVRNDHSNRTLMTEHYTAMAQDPTIHALLGPGFMSWNAEAAGIAEAHGKVMLLWSVDLQVYQTSPFTVVGNPWSLEDSLQAALNEELELQPALPQPPAPPRVTGGTATSFVFELNPSLQNWTISALDYIGTQNHNFMFVWYADYPGNGIFEAQCVAGARHVYARGGKAAYLPLHVYSQLSRELGVLVSGNPDVVVMCGPESVFRNFIKHLQVQNLFPALLMTGWPLAETITEDTRAAWLTHTVEPMAVPPPDFQRPDPVFRSFLTFVTDWLQVSPFYPRYEVQQICGALSLLHAALSALGAGGFSSEALAIQIHGSSIPTVLGTLEFEADGQRKPNADSVLGTRQLLPLSREDGYTIYERFTRNSHFLVAPTTIDSCRSEACKGLALENVQVSNYTSWSLKILPTYPCLPGCLRGGATCMPCPLDTYRTAFDPVCKPCPAGLFAPTPGTSLCVECPTGAECGVGQPPFPQYGHCRVQPWNGSCAGGYPRYEHVDEEIFTGMDASRCINVLDTEPVFEWCLPARVCPGGASACVGSNQGLLCGQCARGQTTHAFLPGRRLCVDCPSRWGIFARLIWVVLVWIALVMLFSAAAVKSARAADFVPTSLMRAVMHYCHVMSVVCELTHLDSRAHIAVMLFIPDHFYRPQEIASMQCLTSDDDWPMSSLSVSSVAKQVDVIFAFNAPPVGLCCIILLHGGAAFGWFAWSRVRSPVMRVLTLVGGYVNAWCVRLARITPKKVARKAQELAALDSDKLTDGVNDLVEQSLRTTRAAAETVIEQGKNIMDQKIEFGEVTAREREIQEEIRLPESDSEGEDIVPDNKLLDDRPARNSKTSKTMATEEPEEQPSPMSPGEAGAQSQTTAAATLCPSEVSKATSKAGKDNLSERGSAENSEKVSKASKAAKDSLSERGAENSEKVENSEGQEKSFSLVASYRPRDKSHGPSKYVLEDAYHRNVNFKPYDWASINFNQQHARRNLRKRLQDIVREMLIWNLMTYPMLIRSVVRLAVCRMVTTGPGSRENRWLSDFNVPCDDDSRKLFINVAVILAIGLPVLSLVFLSFELKDLLSLDGRRVTTIFTSGYKPDAYYWEVISILRSGALVFTAYIPLLTLRCAVMFSIIMVVFLMEFFMMPYEATERFALQRFSMYSQIGVLLIIVLGVIVQEEKDTNLGGEILESEALVTIIEVVVICYNLAVVFFAFMSAFVYPAGRDLQNIRENGGTVSWSLDKVLWLLRNSHGMNKILYYQDAKTGEYIIDASGLNGSERKFFAHCMNELISACIDSSQELHTWLVRRAIHEAFLRAWRGMLAKQKHLYQSWGLRTHSVFCLSCFETQLRNPDIILDACLQADENLLRLTVEEFYVALSDVNYDIMEHQGPLRKEPERDKLMDHFKPAHSSFGVTRWLQTEGLNTLLEELKVTGKLKRRRKQRRSIGSDSSSDTDDAELERSNANALDLQGNNPVLEELELEMEAHRADLDMQGDRAVGEAELIQELADLEEQIDELAEYLGERRAAEEERAPARRRSISDSEDEAGGSSREDTATPLPATPMLPSDADPARTPQVPSTASRLPPLSEGDVAGVASPPST